MKKFIIGIMAMSIIFTGSLMTITGTSQAAIKDEVCKGVGATGQGCDTTGDAQTNANRIVTLVIDTFSWIIGVVSVIMIMVGGFKYITANGDTGKVGSAKNTIIYAIIGLIIVALAQTIVSYVLNIVVPPPTPPTP